MTTTTPANVTPKDTREALTAEQTLAMIRIMATPPDFDDLIARGLLKQARGGWYDLLVRPDGLPQRAGQHVIQMRATKTGPQLKFQSAASIARFARDMERRGGNREPVSIRRFAFLYGSSLLVCSRRRKRRAIAPYDEC